MADGLAKYKESIDKILNSLSKTQKIIIASVTGLVVVGIFAISIMSKTPDYAVLFSDLQPEDANKIIEKLNERSIEYKLSNAGKTINVPRENVYELRLALAGEGMPFSGVVGYEIFDKTNFGISDFQQKVNYKRALQGELVRTVQRLEAVENAQINIVVPEKALFKEDQKKTTASVIIKLKPNKPSLSTENIVAISNLIASSVEGLEPNNITIIDSKGNLLSSTEQRDHFLSLSASQYDIKRKVELHLTDKAQSMLNQVLGFGKSVVKVDAELDFSQMERTSRTYDPNNVIRSQETNDQSKYKWDSVPPSTKGVTLTNYEVGETVEHLIGQVGSIRRLTVAVIVDGTYRDVESDSQIVREYHLRPPDQMAKITGIVRTAVGFSDTRRDQISVETMFFESNIEDNDIVSTREFETSSFGLVQQLLALFAMLIGVFIVRSMLSKFKPKPVPKERPRPKLARIALKPLEEKSFKPVILEPSAGDTQDEIGGREVTIKERPKRPVAPIIEVPEEEEPTEEELKFTELKTRVAGYVMDKPVDAINLVKVWLGEDDGK
jgi:flagellar M-ring protein FliF